jgi:ubiquinone/menaquinone biosynthesis C-methylase UbiE
VCLETPLRRLANIDYLSADYDSTLAMDQIDVRDIQYGSESFDGVICIHVLQLIDDDRTAMSELCRIVKPGGWALIQSLVDDGREGTIEDSTAPVGGDRSERYEEVFQRVYGRAG